MKAIIKKIKDYKTLKLSINFQKNGIVKLKTIDDEVVAKASGYGYNKVSQCFYDFFKNLGYKIDYINLFDLDIERANKFLKENNIDYKIFYKSEINKNTYFIEFIKI